MKHALSPHLSLTALTFLMFPLSAGAETGAERPALMIEGEEVDPLCFLSRDDEESGFPVTSCLPDDIELTPAALPETITGNYHATAYEQVLEGGPDDEEAFRFPGFIGYRYLGDFDEHKAILLIENTGGSGVFTTLMLLDYDEVAGQLMPRRYIAGGDRCTGGIVNAAIENGKLIYEQSVTPYDMIGLTGDPERALLQSDAAQQLPFCAVCCYGRALYENETFTGLRFDDGLSTQPAEKSYRDDQDAAACFDRLVALNIKGGHSAFDAEGFSYFIREVEHVCLGRMEGEE